MLLREWLKREGIKPSQFARQCGITRQRLNYILKTPCKPNENLQGTIYRITKGEVNMFKRR